MNLQKMIESGASIRYRVKNGDCEYECKGQKLDAGSLATIMAKHKEYKIERLGTIFEGCLRVKTQ